MKIRVILNRGGGSAAEGIETELHSLFSEQGVEADIQSIAPEDLAEACRKAAAEPGLDALVAGGGDGTIGTAAAALVDGGPPLGILPLGTLNHFARDAGIPFGLKEAVAVIASGEVRRVDLAEVNGRIFVNNSAVGLYPEIVRAREAQQHHLGRSKRLAMMVAGMRAFYRFSRRRLSIRIAGREAPIETPLLFIGNNRYQMTPLTLGKRDSLDRGELCLYAPLARHPLHFLGIVIRAVVGRTDGQKDFVTINGLTEVEIDSSRPQIRVATDGEAQMMETPLRYKILPGALRLIAPALSKEP